MIVPQLSSISSYSGEDVMKPNYLEQELFSFNCKINQTTDNTVAVRAVFSSNIANWNLGDLRDLFLSFAGVVCVTIPFQ